MGYLEILGKLKFQTIQIEFPSFLNFIVWIKELFFKNWTVCINFKSFRKNENYILPKLKFCKSWVTVLQFLEINLKKFRDQFAKKIYRETKMQNLKHIRSKL